MAPRTRKPVLAICARSGIEALLQDMVQDGYIKGIKVLPAYYEPPQPVRYRPRPEMPPFNPQPLADVWKSTVTLGQTIDIQTGFAIPPPFSLTQTGVFKLNHKTPLAGVAANSALGAFGLIFSNYPVYLTGVSSTTAVGSFAFTLNARVYLSGVSSNTAVGSFVTNSAFGDGGFGTGPFGGNPGGFGDEAFGQNNWGG